MSVNPKLPDNQKFIYLLSQISDTLQHISTNISHEMGPFKVREVSTLNDQMKVEWDRQEELNQLKQANEISSRTAKLAVFGLIASVILGIFQIVFQVWQYSHPQESVEVIVVDKRQE